MNFWQQTICKLKLTCINLLVIFACVFYSLINKVIKNMRSGTIFYYIIILLGSALILPAVTPTQHSLWFFILVDSPQNLHFDCSIFNKIITQNKE